jgi:hypothetical protein
MKQLFCVISVLLISFNFQAQTTPPPTGEVEIDAYIPDTLNEIRNAFKLDPLLIFKGEFVLNYERAISNHFAAEITIGVTRRNWTLPWLGLDADDLRRNINVKTGPTVKLGVRYYTKNSRELHGFYLMPQVAYRVYEKEFAEIDSGGALNGTKHLDRRSIKEVSLTLGYQHLSLYSNFVLDVYATLGYEERELQQVSRIPDTIETLYQTRNYKAFGLNPMVGLRLGFGF